MGKKYIFYLLLCTALIITINGCNKAQVFSNRYFSIRISPKWDLMENDSTKYVFKQDTVYLKINVHQETELQNMLLRTPEEYINTEDGNLLSSFVFSDSNIIYTSKDYIDFVKESVLQDTVKKNYTVKENKSPNVRRFIKVLDISNTFDDIDYLCEFVNGNDVRWLPIKLPKYFKDFDFTIDTTSEYYKKIYYPKLNTKGKIGFVYHSYKSDYTLIVQSSLVTGSSPIMNDIKEIINSIEIKKK